MEMTFSDIEMRFILAEMIKASSIDVSLLVDFIQTHHLEQNWFHMQLPVGRNLSQCMGAVEKLFPVQFPAPPNPTSLKRKSLGEIPEEPTKRQAITTRTDQPLTQRNIQPRPPPPAGYAPIAPASGTPAVTASGKKRGRPSKADKEAQARASYPRNMTPAPLAPLVLAPQRAYASSPRYEVSNGCADPRVKKHDMDPGGATTAPAAYPPPPASSTDVPRALPEPMDQVEERTRSPPERGSALSETRSPAVPSHRDIPHTQAQPLPPPLPHLNTPLFAAPRHPPLYSPQPVSRPDPIFPDRDRNRGVGGYMPRKTPPALSPAQT